MKTEYLYEKAVWGNRYFVRVYEDHKNMPGFAPEVYEVLICEIWMEYSDWDRRIEFEECRLQDEQTLKTISKIFKEKFDKKKYKLLEKE